MYTWRYTHYALSLVAMLFADTYHTYAGRVRVFGTANVARVLFLEHHPILFGLKFSQQVSGGSGRQ